MPIFESDEITRDKLEEIRKRNVCAVCGGWLNTFLDAESGKVFVACYEWSRTHHQGIEREPSRYEKEGLASLNIPTRREIMEKEHGLEATKTLAKYMGGGQMTRPIATEIVDTLWRGAPQIEKTKVIILCETYQLNPLMRHIHLVGYRRGEKGGGFVLNAEGKPVIDWSIQIGIGATRLMAQRKHSYKYVDYSPRPPSPSELKKMLGDQIDHNQIYGFCWIRDTVTSAEAFGLRGVGKTEKIKGEEKGNTRQNQANIRAERQALDRQYPGEMPGAGYEVVDERYMDADYRVVDEKTGEIIEHIAEEPEPEPEPATESDPKEHWCEEHDCAYEKKHRGSAVWYAHKRDDGSWCNEIKKKEKEQAPASVAEAVPETVEPEPETKAERDPSTIMTITDLFKACHEDFNMQPDQVIKELGYSLQTDISDTPADCYRKIAAVRVSKPG